MRLKCPDCGDYFKADIYEKCIRCRFKDEREKIKPNNEFRNGFYKK